MRTAAPDDADRRRPVPAILALLLAGAAVLVLAAALSVAFGTRVVGWNDLVSAFTTDADGIAEAAVRQRIPRTLLAMLVGASLGVAGAVLQGLTRNPLADPMILGVTPGASLAVVSGIAFFGLSTATGYIWVAITGAALASAFVYGIGSLGRGGPTPLKLALSGAATTAAFTSLISAILLPRVDVLNSFRFWQVGGVGGATYTKLGQVLPFLIVGALICIACSRGLNSLALGDELATGLGERVMVIRVAAFVGAVTLCGAATAVAGPIAFVGLVVPHVCRLLIGVDHRWLLPSAAMVGALLLTVADVVGRVVARPSEIEVGIVTAIIGAPFFIYVVRKQKVRAL
ncbi:iron ABC transporter permease [Aeromicrobium phragmitis]|uniref:Iron ABC transporter permease n=1 Tax=Aeromicrobium phragmitis TaxID=2478914 RepID=A0A3L8PKZ0_9ACTN|nr:iron ABC transporter permease [Aeromicrobium phragmitis]RLV56066.1 iron ABC transporter permease [Aeromicrobium phragmitis]